MARCGPAVNLFRLRRKIHRRWKMFFFASEANSGAARQMVRGENSESTQPGPLLFGKSPGPDLDAFEGIRQSRPSR